MFAVRPRARRNEGAWGNYELYGDRDATTPNEPNGLVFEYHLAAKSERKADIIDADAGGTVVRTIEGPTEAGMNRAAWNGMDEKRNPVAPASTWSRSRWVDTRPRSAPRCSRRAEDRTWRAPLRGRRIRLKPDPTEARDESGSRQDRSGIRRQTDSPQWEDTPTTGRGAVGSGFSRIWADSRRRSAPRPTAKAGASSKIAERNTLRLSPLEPWRATRRRGRVRGDDAPSRAPPPHLARLTATAEGSGVSAAGRQPRFTVPGSTTSSRPACR